VAASVNDEIFLAHIFTLGDAEVDGLVLRSCERVDGRLYI
jgi:hypothetical protein